MLTTESDHYVKGFFRHPLLALGDTQVDFY